MYLHIGQDTVVRSDDILGIFDIESSSISAITREYLAASEQSGRVINVTSDLPKSFIVCVPADRRSQEIPSVYISQISTGTLYKRAGLDDSGGIPGLDKG